MKIVRIMFRVKAVSQLLSVIKSVFPTKKSNLINGQCSILSNTYLMVIKQYSFYGFMLSNFSSAQSVPTHFARYSHILLTSNPAPLKRTLDFPLSGRLFVCAVFTHSLLDSDLFSWERRDYPSQKCQLITRKCSHHSFLIILPMYPFQMILPSLLRRFHGEKMRITVVHGRRTPQPVPNFDLVRGQMSYPRRNSWRIGRFVQTGVANSRIVDWLMFG